MFWALPRPSSGAYNCISSLWFLPLERGGSSVVGRGLAEHDKKRCYHHASTWGNVRRKYTVTIYDRLVSGDTFVQ
jgi:hypothetical protein